MNKVADAKTQGGVAFPSLDRAAPVQTVDLNAGPEIHVLDDVLAFHGETKTVQLFKGAAADAVATNADPDPPPGTLMDRLKATKAAPSSTEIAAVPSDVSDADLQHLNDILLLNSYVSVASMRYLYKTRPNGWDITQPQEAADFTRAVANAKFKILTEGLGSFLTLDTTSARSFHESTTTADLHLSFLTTLFQGFGFPKKTMLELDSVLTSVNQTLSDLRLSWSDQNSTLDHLVFVYYFDDVEGLQVKLPKMRLFFLHIDQASWTASLGKSSVSHFDFNMNFDDNIFNMNPAQVALYRDQIQKLIADMTQASFDDINKLLTPVAVDADQP